MDNRKICKQCGKVKEHGVNRANPDGLMGSRCRDCELERTREYNRRSEVIRRKLDVTNSIRAMKGQPPHHITDVLARNYWPLKADYPNINPKYSSTSNHTRWFSLEKLNQVYNRWYSR